MPQATPAVPATISLMAAAALLGRSKRTLWRRVSDGALCRAPDDAAARTMLFTKDIAAELPWRLSPEEWDLVARADAGDATAQATLAGLLLKRELPAAAVYWWALAAKQGHADAMQWLARAYLAGEGVAADANVGMMWLAKAAAASHPIALAQMDGLTQLASTAQHG